MLTSAAVRLRMGIGKAEISQAFICAGYIAVSAVAIILNKLVLGLGIAIMGAGIAWHLSNRRWRLIHDIPTTRIRSAAQGFVELAGTADLSPGQVLQSINGLPPCVWYEVIISDSGVGSHGVSTWTRSSDETFVLRDDTGHCVIDPDHSEVHRAHTKNWRIVDRAYQAHFLLQGDPLYAIGSIETIRGGGGHDRQSDISALLRDWKRNPDELKRRFDSNFDGEFSGEEWLVAVKEAERVVDLRHKEDMAHPDTHIMRAPKRGLPYILSNQDPESLALRFRYWSWFHLTVFIGTMLACAWVNIV